MNLFTLAILNHVRLVQEWARTHGAQATIDVADFKLHVRKGERDCVLYPQFLASTSTGGRTYKRQLDETASGFVGWLPYVNKRWPIGSGKLAFKEFCQRNELPTPRIWRAPDAELRDFVVKHDGSSFSAGLQGPFSTYAAGDRAQRIDEKGYYESFVRGSVVKAWFWDGRPAAVEIKDMPCAAGDGRSTLRQLIEARLLPQTPESEWIDFGQVAAYQGLALDAVPAPGQSVIIDFRWGSYAYPVRFQNFNRLRELEGTALLEKFGQLGRALWLGIPEEQRPATLFTVDGVIDAEDRVWLLEMNCNPTCHPDVYPLMLETLVGSGEARAETPSLQPAGGAVAGYTVLRPGTVSFTGSRTWRIS